MNGVQELAAGHATDSILRAPARHEQLRTCSRRTAKVARPCLDPLSPLSCKTCTAQKSNIHKSQGLPSMAAISRSKRRGITKEGSS